MRDDAVGVFALALVDAFDAERPDEGEVELVRRDGVAAPAAALRREGDTARLDVVRDGRVEERVVTPGIVEGDKVEIKDGLAEGESVVARAAAFLRPGDRVRPMPETIAAGG